MHSRKGIFKVTLVVLTFIVTASMTACGSKTTGSTSENGTTKAVNKTVAESTTDKDTTKGTKKDTENTTTKGVSEDISDKAETDAAMDVAVEDKEDNTDSTDNTDNYTPEYDEPEITEPEPMPEPDPTPEPMPEPEEPTETEVITKVNPYDGKTYRYVAPEDMDLSLPVDKTINGNPEEKWDITYDDTKILTTRTYYAPDGTYTELEGWYAKVGDITATPKQMGYSLDEIIRDYIPVGIFYFERDDRYVGLIFNYLKP